MKHERASAKFEILLTQLLKKRFLIDVSNLKLINYYLTLKIIIYFFLYKDSNIVIMQNTPLTILNSYNYIELRVANG